MALRATAPCTVVALHAFFCCFFLVFYRKNRKNRFFEPGWVDFWPCPAAMYLKTKTLTTFFGAVLRLILLRYGQKLPKFNVKSSFEQRKSFFLICSMKTKKKPRKKAQSAATVHGAVARSATAARRAVAVQISAPGRSGAKRRSTLADQHTPTRPRIWHSASVP